MTARNGYDWSPLDLDCDPIPGDHDAVGATARQYKNTAKSLESAADNLRRLRSDETCSEAVTKILKSSSEMAAQLDLVRVRYEVAGTALANYAPVLRKTQDDSVAALVEAGRARQTYNRQQENARSNYDRAKAATTPQEQQNWVDATTQAVAQRNAAAGEVADAKRRLQAAIDERNSAADTAATQIEDAVSSSPVNDTGWDKFKQFMKPAIDVLKAVGKWAWDHIDGIALVLTIAAVALSWVPFLGAGLAVAATIARGLAVLKAGIALSKDLIEAGRTGDWGAVGRTLLLGGVELLLARVGGKVITRALKNNSRVLMTRSVELGQQSLGRFNALRRGVAHTVSHLRSGPFVAPSPISPRWLQPGTGGRSFRMKLNRFIQGESVRSIRNVPNGGWDPASPHPLIDYIGPHLPLPGGLRPLGLHHSNLHEGVEEAWKYGVDKGMNWVQGHIGQQRTEVQPCR